MKQTFHVLFILIITMMLAGCCTINKQAAQKLADEGGVASTDIAKSYGITKQQLVTYVEGEYLLSALKEGYSKPSTEMLNSIKKVQTELALRQQMLEDLAALYSAFGALCSYDAVAETEKATGQLAAAGKTYAEAVFPGTTIPDAAGQIFAKGAGQISGQAQSCHIRDASRRIRANLDGIVFLLKKQNEQEALVAIREEVSRNRLKVATNLWNENVGLADDILKGLVSAYGLNLNQDVAKNAGANPRLKNAILQVLQVRHDSEMEAASDAYSAAIKALNKLNEEHKKLEKGEDVSLASLDSDLVTIRAYIDLVTTLKKELK